MSRPQPMAPAPLALLWATALALTLLLAPQRALAQIQASPQETGTGLVRSLESLRDLDYQSWQVVAYREGPQGGALRLRIVGYPGRMRQEQPTPLLVSSGRLLWELENVTLASP